MNIKNIFELIEKKYTIDSQKTWSKGHSTYLEEIEKELKEVREEIKTQRKNYLEDELGDVLWDYLNLLYNLEKEGKIQVNMVFERTHKKYSERINGVLQGKTWEEIKKLQKEKLKKESKNTI